MKNIYGLSLESAYVNTNFVNVGSPVQSGGYIFENYDEPDLQITDYFFTSQTPFLNYIWSSGYTGPAPVMPGSPTFATTNTSPLLITGIGQPITVSGWAKMAIANGDANKFAYLEQYFDRAYSIDTNGSITTNSTGLLSPYGDFFPTIPGPATLVTMPDTDTGERGTGVVNVIKLQLDVNHDGTMDLSFGGPDNTSQAHPFEFWINNDLDIDARTAFGTPLDFGHDVELSGTNIPVDCNYPVVNSQRDLEDFARIWICGVPALTTAGCQVTLNMNASSGSPAINLVKSIETNGGTLYLSDTNYSLAQATGNGPSGAGYKFASITPNQSYTFPSTFFTNSGNKYFLFEGAGVGSGELVLTISQGTNIIGRTSAWIDLHDVKDLYERVTIQNASDDPPSDTVSTYQIQNQISDKAAHQTAVFVHGWRMGVADYYSFSESMFKRLYWQGFAGKFVSIRWPTLSKDDFFLPVLDLFTYNHSEFRSFESGRGLAAYLTDLRGRFPDDTISVASHSMGGIITMRALKWHLTNGRQDINNYVLMQAAVPAHCYDTNLPNYAPFMAAEASSPTPDAYRGYPGSINEAVRGNLVNFYNTNDYALATGTFGLKSVSWEQNQIDYKPDAGYASEGTIGYTANYNVSDPRELMSFVARPRSKAVGALPGVTGVIQGGDVDLKANFGFNDKKDQHSAQFNWSIQQLSGFYESLLNALFPPGQ